MNLRLRPFNEQKPTWPQEGRHILAQYDEQSIVVYQAYRPSIGEFAARNGYFGGDFKYSRMSWIKPNFLWMMYRSDWGKSEGQEVILAVRLHRAFFDMLLAQAVVSSYQPDMFSDRKAWQEAVDRSDVRLQWDPDHEPNGQKCERRAVQLGLRGNTLAQYGEEAIVEIQDVSPLVAEQRVFVEESCLDQLLMPEECVYIPDDLAAASNVRLSRWPE